jgi:hypothetical protein
MLSDIFCFAAVAAAVVGGELMQPAGLPIAPLTLRIY